jgi:putative ABC transport system substrate-binding protein
MINKDNVQNKKGNWLGVFILMVVGSLFLSGCGAQAAPKVYRVGILNGFERFAEITDGFKTGMIELGYVEGENIIYDVQKTNADPVEEERTAAKFVADGVDLILAFPTGSALAAKAATQGTDVPVVFALGAIEGNDLVDSVAQPGGNITGVRFPGPDLVVKRLELLLDLAPQIERLYIPHDPNYPNSLPTLEALRPAASSLGVTLVEVPVNSVEEIEADLQARTEADDIGVDAIFILPERLTQSLAAWEMITRFAAEHSLPLVGSSDSSVEIGAVFSYSTIPYKVGEQAAPLADQVLKGTPAGTIIVVTAEAYLRLNYKLAQELGLTVPEGILNLATDIIR